MFNSRNLILSLFLCVCSILQSQIHYAFTSIDCKNGLSENRVRNIVQLKDGRLVISTEGVTNIFDGTSFKHLHLKGENVSSLSAYDGFHHGYVDKDHVWIKDNGRLMIIDIRLEQFIPNPENILLSMGINEPLADFFMDANGGCWFLTSSDKLMYHDSKMDKSIEFLQNVSLLSGTKLHLLDLAVIKQQVYLFYRNGIMVCYDLISGKLQYRKDIFPNEGSNNYYRTLMLVQSEHSIFQLWNRGTGGELIELDIQNRAFNTVLKTDYWLNTISIDKASNLWVSCHNGMWFISKNHQQKQLISSFKLVDGTIVKTEASTQCNDSQGGLWIGTFNHGLLYYHVDRFKFKNIGRVFFKPQDIDLNVNCFEELNPDVFIVGTSNGLYRYSNMGISLIKEIPHDVNCLSLKKDRNDRIWLCTYNRGLYCIQDDRIRHYELKNMIALQVYENPDGEILIVTDREGFGTFNPETGSYHRINMSGNEPTSVSQIIPFEKKSVLVKSGTDIFLYDFQNKNQTQFLHDVLKNEIKIYNCILKDSKGLVWLGTQDGLLVWQPDTNVLYQLYTDDGLVNNSIKGILEDSKGRIWTSTAGGVSHIEVTNLNKVLNFSITSFNYYDGVIESEFIPNSIFMSGRGTLLMGGVNGFNSIDLETPWVLTNLQKPLFTSFALFGNTIKQGESYNGSIVLKQSITATNRLILRHNQNFITLDFSALNFVNPTQTYYRYRLEGIDEDWREVMGVNGTGRASYTNLSPGTYTFKVKAANNSKHWTGDFSQMVIIIKAPFWKTPFAYFIYLVILLLFLFQTLKSYKRWTHKQLARKNEEKLNEMKFAFFTNISHEFRTPLTLIITPLETLLKEIQGAALVSKVQTIYRHAQLLQNLVNQLLDFRRLEITGEKLNLTIGNFAEFIQIFEELFERLASDQKISFTVTSEQPVMHVYFDRDKMFKIINNLLSNAFKFTPVNGSIKLNISRISGENESGFIILEVIDSGSGIAPGDIPNLFNQFYQAQGVKSGSGIGLHLVKEYVKLHSGEITVQSEPNIRTVFSIKIPDNLTPSSNGNIEPIVPLEDKNANIIQEKYPKTFKLLVVEDNDDLRHFIFDELSKKYDVIEASDGEAGATLARSESPDLIISDVLMPRMSGLELCAQIKSDIQTSHIPVILLTARSSEMHRIEGYTAGADEYLSKPFSMEILLLRITNLIEQNNHRRKQFTQRIEVNPKAITITSIDEKLIQKALSCIEENMDNPNYSVQQFSLEMGMDRTVLYKKLQSITGLSPSDFIRSIRLKRAAMLLSRGQYPVNEVADKVGFNSTKYFTKYFKDAFGMPPSQYAKNSRNSEYETQED